MLINFPPALSLLFEAVSAQARRSGLSLYAVGGFVRDLLLNQTNTDIDLVVEGDAIAFAHMLAERYGGTVRNPSQFLTTAWILDAKVADALNLSPAALPEFIDFVTARRESYARPGALPTVQPGSIREDLQRRDFTINTLALRLAPAPSGDLIDFFGGVSDLQAGVIRILNDQSFIDDPTRLFRAVRFEQRLYFQIESHSASLLPQALPFIDRLSGERIQHELQMIFAESEPEKSLTRLEMLRILPRVHQRLTFDEWLRSAFITARHFHNGQFAQNAWKPSEISLSNVYWALLGARLDNPEGLIERLHLPTAEISAVRQGWQAYRRLPSLEGKQRPSDIVRILSGLMPVGLVVVWIIATEAVRSYISRYVLEWQETYPTIGGNDLLAMGLKPGKLFGKLLARLREAWLDGLISTPEQERIYLKRLIDGDEKANDDNH